MFYILYIKCSLENNEIYDIDYEKSNSIINNCEKGIEYFEDMCVELSYSLDNDNLHLHINRKFNK